MLRKTILRVLAISLICFVSTGIYDFASASGSGSIWGLSITEQRSTMPGEYVTLVATLQNTGANLEILEIEVEAPTDWGLLPLPKALSLTPGAEELLFITLNLPKNTLAGQYQVTMTASSQWGVQLTKIAVVEVLQTRKLALEPSELLHILPGQTGLHSVTVHNLGNVSELVNLNVSPPDGWLIRSDLRKLPLKPGASQTVTFSLSVPKETKPASDYFTVDVSSTDGRVQANANLDVMVLPPTPDLVAELGPDALPATFYISTGNIKEAGLRLGNAKLTARGSVGDDAKIDLNSRVYALKTQQSYRGHFDLSVERLPWSFGFSLVPEAKDVTEHRYVLGYDLDPWSVRLGDVDRRITPLIRVAGRGATVDYFGKLKMDCSVIVLNQAKGASIHKEFGPTDWRFTYLARGDDLGDVFGAHSQIKVTDNIGISGEIANVGGSTSTALGANWRNGKFYAAGHYFWYGENYINIPGDRTGYELDFCADFEKIPMALRLEKTRENVKKDNKVLTIENKAISFGTSIPMGSLILDGFVQGKTKTTWQPDEVAPINANTLDTRVALSQKISNWSWEVSNETKVINDDIDEDQEASISTKATLYYDWDRAGVYLGYGLIGEGATLNEARGNMCFAPLLGISYYPETRLVDYIFLDYQGGAHPVLTLANQVGVDIGNSRLFLKSELKHKDEWEWDVRAGLTVRFDLPVPGVYSNGQIQGRVFVIDGETTIGIGQVILKTKSTKVTTDDDGYFRFPPLKEGVYEISVENLPQNSLIALELPLEIQVEAGGIHELEIPINQVASILGILRPEPTSGVPYSTVPNLEGVVIELRQREKVVQTARTSSDGYYQFWNLEPGKYELQIVEKTLPKRYKVTTTNPVAIDLRPTERIRVNFDLKEELSIVTTYEGK